MTGFNHAITGAAIAAVTKEPLLAVPIAFLSHFILDAIPHFGWDMGEDVFKRNRSKQFRIAAALETPLSISVLVAMPIMMKPIVSWWVTLLSMLAALSMDLIWIYRGIREEITKKVKPRNWIMNFHLKISHHHAHFMSDMIFELAWFGVLLVLILHLVNSK